MVLEKWTIGNRLVTVNTSKKKPFSHLPKPFSPGKRCAGSDKSMEEAENGFLSESLFVLLGWIIFLPFGSHEIDG